jgi:8-oxo-dGTP pyrophosphatase MutT (NUDIX family)
MAYYNKIGLLVLNEDSTRFLVCEKDNKNPKSITSDYIMPGGLFEEDSVEECLRNEIKEELDCAVDFDSLEYIGEYTDVAADRPDRDVSIKLYKGKLIGTPKPKSEIKSIHWIGKEDQKSSKVSPIIRNKIIPELLKRKILVS